MRPETENISEPRAVFDKELDSDQTIIDETVLIYISFTQTHKLYFIKCIVFFNHLMEYQFGAYLITTKGGNKICLNQTKGFALIHNTILQINFLVVRH